MNFDPLKAYELMYLCRHVDEEIACRYSEGDMRTPTHLSIGQESVAVGVKTALPHDAHVFASHRCHAHYLAKGGDLDAMIAEIYGKAAGCCGGRGGSMHLWDESVGFMGAFPIVGDAISLAVGSALAAKFDGSNRVTAVFFGDSAMESGQLWESLNFAALHKLGILFVCENNGLATQTRIEQRQPMQRSIWERVVPWMRSFRTDDEVERVHWVTEQALQELPAFMEVRTYRWKEHVGPKDDWDLGYRDKSELGPDPLSHAREALSEPEVVSDIEWAVQTLVNEAFEKAERAAWPEAAHALP